MITILGGPMAVHAEDAVIEGDHFWVSAADLEVATGWTLKPEGLCRERACVALPADGCWRDGAGRVDLAAFAAHVGLPVVDDDGQAAFAVGESAGFRGEQLLAGEAPDFALPDLDGAEHRLSDYRGRKVFLFAYGSYCACSFDLPGWQVVYDELEDRDVEFISVALDAGSKAAVERRIRAEDIPDRDPVIRRLMGWSEEQWDRQAPPEYPCLIDVEHVVADLFNMTHVPTAVWIDEEGRIVRPAEAAGFGDEVDRGVYIAALRDWAANGAESSAALSPEEVRARTRLPGESDVRAAAHARLGHHLFARGDHEGAKAHFRAAAELAPGKWSYRRQSMVLDPGLVGELGEGCHHPPAELPGVRRTEHRWHTR